MTETILSLNEVHTYIAQHHILQGVTLDVTLGSPTVFLGRNGAGKSSTLRAIMGLNPVTSGEIHLAGQPLQGRKPYEIARLGVGFVAEDRAVFYNLSVEENIRLSMFEESEQALERVETVLALFPDLKRLWRCNAGLLSGGQKQMLAIGRAFVNDHRILLIDEPSKGLAPIVVDQVGESLIQIKDHTTIILVEQNFHLASMVGTDYFILDDGRVVHQGLMQNLVDDQELKQKYLGIG
ncbi:MAG: ABC transporter ATP-binding protein [Desulfobacterales bacterium]|jgi:branched-chain amino acid transport system ATP-binding protein